MSSETLIITGLQLCLLGTLSGGILALLGKKQVIQRITQIIVLVALALGTLASGFFLVKHLPALPLLTNPFFFSEKLMLDHLSAIFFFLISAVGFLAMIYGLKYLSNESGHYHIPRIQFLSALFIVGMQLVVLATTPIFFLFAWEIMSFSSFFLVMADLKTESIRPALFYLIMTHLGAGAILAGFLILSGGNFSADFATLASLASAAPKETLLITFLLFFFGFGSKAGLFPLHGWLPEAHPQAPSHISALMSGIMLKIAVYGMLRVILFMLPVLPLEMGFLVVAIGLFSAIFGVFYSLIETDIKRILAYSSIENLGLIFSMIGVHMAARTMHMETLAQVSLLITLYQSICHALFKSGLFLTAGAAAHFFHTRNIEKMGGMARVMRLFSLAALLLSLTAAALPPSGAFIGEWMVFQSILDAITSAAFSIKVLLLLVLIVFGLVAGLAVFSMVRFFGMAFLAESRSPKISLKEGPGGELLYPILFLGLLAFLLGIFSEPLFSMINANLTNEFLAPFAPFSFNPLALPGILLGLIFLAFLFRRAASDAKNERLYHTWNCGQPIDSSMEYTATAFSAPIRFFFKSIVRANKKLTATPLAAANPWLTKKSIHLEIRPIWDNYFYNPLLRVISFASSSLRRLQNGNIQFYISLILISLIITAIITL